MENKSLVQVACLLHHLSGRGPCSTICLEEVLTFLVMSLRVSYSVIPVIPTRPINIPPQGIQPRERWTIDLKLSTHSVIQSLPEDVLDWSPSDMAPVL